MRYLLDVETRGRSCAEMVLKFEIRYHLAHHELTQVLLCLFLQYPYAFIVVNGGS